MTRKVRLDFNVLIYPDDGWWIAHCLEMDLPAEGKSPFDAMKNLIELTNLQVTTALEEGDLGSIFSPAPPDLWSMYATAKDCKFTRRPRKTITSVRRLNVRELEFV